jgi:hypothetical protein
MSERRNPLEVSQWAVNEYAKNARATRRERKLADKKVSARHA